VYLYDITVLSSLGLKVQAEVLEGRYRLGTMDYLHGFLDGFMLVLQGWLSENHALSNYF
jgi:hypothetical protein